MSGLSLTVPEKMESSLQYDKQVVHIGAFEGMQGVAALMVFCAHLHSVIFREGLDAQFGSRTMALSKAFGSARSLGVEVFFLLSGFLVYGSLRSKRFCWSDYLKRRFLRLFPVFLFVLSLYILLSILFPSATRLSSNGNPLLYILANALMLLGLFPVVPIITAPGPCALSGASISPYPCSSYCPGFGKEFFGTAFCAGSRLSLS